MPSAAHPGATPLYELPQPSFPPEGSGSGAHAAIREASPGPASPHKRRSVPVAAAMAAGSSRDGHAHDVHMGWEGGKRPASPHITTAHPRGSLSVSRRVGSPVTVFDRMSSPIDDDELHKGHAGTSPHGSSPLLAIRRGSTPSIYRPSRQGSGSSEVPTHPLSHTTRATSASLSSISSSGDGSASGHQSLSLPLSPPVRPAARRGAVRLRRGARRTKLPPTPLPQKIAHAFSCAAHIVSHPRSSAHALLLDVRGRARAADKAFRDEQGNRLWWPEWMNAYTPLLIWLVVSLSSTACVLTWHTQVFQGLHNLSKYLQGLGLKGRIILGSLIFLTTFPPLPLYSTLIVLGGFSFGLLQGFIVAYIAALSGAIVVFLLSRTFLKGWMRGLLEKSGGLKKVVRAIEKRPKLLFLVRLAPYPYNLMNTLLASSPTLTLKTYTTCTALALPKLLVHTGIGTTIKNFAAYNGAAGEGEAAKEAPTDTARTLKRVAGVVGIGLCIGVFFYIFSIASAAVDELDSDDEASDGEDEDLEEEELPFLRRSSSDSQEARQAEMRQVPLRPLSQADMASSLAERRAKRNSVRFAQSPMISTLGADRPYSPMAHASESKADRQDWEAEEPHDTSLVDSIDHFERVAASSDLPRSR